MLYKNRYKRKSKTLKDDRRTHLYSKERERGEKVSLPVVALIMGKNGEKMDFGYGKTFLEKVSWGGPETPFCGISGPIPACGGVYTEKWTKF